MPEKSGTDCAPLTALAPGPAAGDAFCPKAVVAPAAANAINKRKSRRRALMISSLAPACLRLTPACVARSEIRLVRTRDVGILVVMESKRVFGAGDFRPFEAVAQINHGRGPRRREGARVLDGEMDLQVLVIVVGVDGSAGAPILFCSAFQRVLYGFV